MLIHCTESGLLGRTGVTDTEQGRLKVTTTLLELLVGFSSMNSWGLCFLRGKWTIFKGKIDFTKRDYLGSKFSSAGLWAGRGALMTAGFPGLMCSRGGSLGSFLSYSLRHFLYTRRAPGPLLFFSGRFPRGLLPKPSDQTACCAFSLLPSVLPCKIVKEKTIVYIYFIHNTLWVLLNSDTRRVGFANVKQSCDTSLVFWNLLFLFVFCFWLLPKTCKILLLRPGVKPECMPSAVKLSILTTGLPGNSQCSVT